MLKVTFSFLLFCFSATVLVAKPFDVLVFTKTAGFRHKSIPAGVQAVRELGQQAGFNVLHSEDANLFTEKSLKRFRCIVFLSTTGDIFTKAQEKAFERYIQAGGGFVGIHAATDTEYGWPWYTRLVGGQFASHPNQQEAVQERVKIHKTTKFLPKRWKRFDEWYNFKNYSPRIKVLLNLDEKTYKGGKNGEYHPSAWYQEYDGGRMFYTAGGHTIKSFQEKLFRRHILAGILYTADKVELDYKKALPSDEYFEVETLIDGLHDPIEIAVTAEEKVFLIEREGAVKFFDPAYKTVKKIHQLDIVSKNKDDNFAKECGGLGICLDPDFANNNFIYIYYSPREKSCNRLSRFTWKDGKLQDEKMILEVMTDRYQKTCHEGGSLAFGKDRLLFISTGDNTNPFQSNGSAPIDERPNRKEFDAQRSSANSNDLRGGILRIRINKDGSYSIPKGNLYKPGTPKTRPEIYVKGCRNPYRISIDKRNGYLYWGDVGPDAGGDSKRGPRGYDEFNQARKASYFGWPYFRGHLKSYNDYNFETGEIGENFAKKLINDSPNNTGLTTLPPAQASMIAYPYAKSELFPELGSGGRNAMAGPVYHQEGRENSFPAYFNNTVFFYEWMRGMIMVVKLDKDQRFVTMNRFLANQRFKHLMDMEQGPKGDLYVLEYGSSWWHNKDGRLRRVSFGGFNRKPVAKLKTDKVNGALPMTVGFSAAGSVDPDGDRLSYKWDFGNGSTSNKKQLKYTFKDAGTYNVTLTVKDPAGRSSSQQIKILAGNEAPKVLVKLNTKSKVFNWGQTLSYKVKAKDKEDGVIAPENVRVIAEYRPDGKVPSLDQEASDPRLAGMNVLLPGTNLIEKNMCIACHQSNVKSIGPSWRAVAGRYEDNAKNRAYLLNKIKKGGNGAWGHFPMPPQGHIADADVKKMIDAIYDLRGNSALISEGKDGKVKLIKQPLNSKDGRGVYVLTASYTDKGANGIPGLTAKKQIVLKAPAWFDKLGEGRTVLSFLDAKIDGEGARFEKGNIGYYTDVKTTLTWKFKVTKAGKYTVSLDQAAPNNVAGSTYELQLKDQRLAGTIQPTGQWQKYKEVKVGELNFAKPGHYQIKLQPLKLKASNLANVRGLIFNKVK